MALDIGLGRGLDDPNILYRLEFWADGYYFFLFDYFQKASLNPHQRLLDLYEDAEIDGEQLDRLEEELNRAKADVKDKMDTWEEVVGWTGIERKKSQEMRETVERKRMLIVIEKLLALVSEARERRLKIIGRGD